jgi:cell division protein ZapA (FtsZ GTPase activity inhibitor)
VSKTEPLTIKIMGKEYRIGCPEEELNERIDALSERISNSMRDIQLV